MTLLECEPFMQYYPSEIAISAIVLAVHTLGYQNHLTSEFIESTTTYERQQVDGDVKSLLEERQACIEALHKMQIFAPEHPQKAIQQKFSTEK